MKNKGFTLVELLAVIAVMGVVMVLVMPTMLKAFNSARKELRKYQGVGLEDAARMYINEIDNETASFTMTEDFTSSDGTVYNVGSKINGYDFKEYIYSKQDPDNVEAINDNAITIPVKVLVDNGYYNKGCIYERGDTRTDSSGKTVKVNEKNCVMTIECSVSGGMNFEKKDGFLVSKKVNVKMSDKCVAQ